MLLISGIANELHVQGTLSPRIVKLCNSSFVFTCRGLAQAPTSAPRRYRDTFHFRLECRSRRNPAKLGCWPSTDTSASSNLLEATFVCTVLSARKTTFLTCRFAPAANTACSFWRRQIGQFGFQFALVLGSDSIEILRVSNRSTC